ncbi:MAG: hypothetical protein ACRD3T_20105 [Terriglobia bacterium]
MKFISHASPEFWTLYDRLPPEVQEQALKQYELFAGDPLHPSLRLKPVGLFWSVRISRRYRALAARNGDQFYWFWIGSHADYDRLIAVL